jgi:hypothetical protein
MARDLRHNIVAADRVRTPVEQEAHDQAAIESASLSRASLRRSHRWIDDMLALACLDHGAGRGEMCWPSVGGICQERVARATLELEQAPVAMSATGIGSRGAR